MLSHSAILKPDSQRDPHPGLQAPACRAFRAVKFTCQEVRCRLPPFGLANVLLANMSARNLVSSTAAAPVASVASLVNRRGSVELRVYPRMIEHQKSTPPAPLASALETASLCFA